MCALVKRVVGLNTARLTRTKLLVIEATGSPILNSAPGFRAMSLASATPEVNVCYALDLICACQSLAFHLTPVLALEQTKYASRV